MSGLADAAFSILMIGHSIFGPTAPDMLQGALRDAGAQAQVQAQIINGAPLRYNWDHSSEAQGVDARAVLPRGGIDHLILTEALPLENHLQGSASGPSATAFARLAFDANPAVTIYVQETWHSRLSGTGATVPWDSNGHIPWRDRLSEDLPKWEGIVDHVRAELPAATVSLIPAGQAMALLHDEVEAGNVPGLRDMSRMFDDDIHQSDLGHYFVTMVQVAAVSGVSPEGTTHRLKDRWGYGFDSPSPELAEALQRIAWQAVSAYRAGERPAPRPEPLAAAPQLQSFAPTLQTASLVTTAPRAEARASTEARPHAKVAIGLAGVADWATQQPFIDLMKTARPLFGHTPGGWGGFEHDRLRTEGYLDANGWPLRKPPEVGSIGTLILTEMPEDATSLAGRYVLMFDGKGIVEVAGRARNVRYGKDLVTFDYTPGPGMVDIRIQRTRESNPVRNIRVIKEEHLPLYEAGEIFSPLFLEHAAKFKAHRYMNWQQTNNSDQSSWSERAKLSDATWAYKDVPVEVMIELANHLGTDAWFNLPHLSDDDYVRSFAQMVHDTLDPELKVYVEYSNEVWNWQFTQTAWTDAEALKRWGHQDVGTQFYALRAAEVAGIWTDVFGTEAEARLVNVISSQTGWLGLEENIFNAPLVVAEGKPRPADAFDAYAITGYFGGVLGLEDREAMVKGWLAESLAQAQADARAAGLSGAALQARVEETKYDLASKLAGQELADGSVSGNANDTLADLRDRVWPYHVETAARHGLDLIMYEGGTHVVGLGDNVHDEELTAFFIHFNYTPEMGALYAELLKGWEDVGGQLFNAYNDIYVPSQWGSWGALRHLDDANPRWDALVAAR